MSPPTGALQPSTLPSDQPSRQPLRCPSVQPSQQPARRPSLRNVTTEVPTISTTEFPILNGTDYYFDSTEVPSESPSSLVITLQVPFYNTSDTFYATVNTVPYTFTVCLTYYNDQFIRLFSDGTLVAANDDSCFGCSVITFYIASALFSRDAIQVNNVPGPSPSP